MIHYASVLAEPFARRTPNPLTQEEPPKMRAAPVSVLLVCLMSTFVPPSAVAQQFEADLVIVNANAHTLDASRPSAEAVAVYGGRVIAVGTSEFIGRFKGAEDRTLLDTGAVLAFGRTGLSRRSTQSSASTRPSRAARSTARTPAAGCPSRR
jgi:hypothetical protein